MSQVTEAMKPKQYKIGVRAETYEKFQRIAKQARRTIAETADVLADEFLSKPSVEVNDAHPSPVPAGDTRSGHSAISAE